MKFSCTQHDLIKALNIVSKAVSSKTTMPILKGILLDAKPDNTLSLSASDLDLSIETSIEATVQEKGALVVQARIFSDIIRKLPAGDVRVEENESGSVDVSCQKTEFKIMGVVPPDEFPVIEESEKGERMPLDKNSLKEMIRKTCFAASIDETRGIITGVLMEVKKESFTMVALDGFRMAVVRENIKNETEKDIVIPARIMNEVGKILAETDAEKEEKDPPPPFDIVLEEKKAVFRLKNTKIVSRILDGSFVKYREIIPPQHNTDALVSKRDLQESIERASILIKEGKNNFIKMAVTDGHMFITSRSEEGSIHEEINIDKTGEDLEIGFNARFLLDVLKAVPEEEIKLEFNTPVSPCIIRPLQGESFEYLILPVRLVSGF
ncbi:MAG: DNA polymerase III subunit beta [Clostridiales Family XIII bacterium]|jgi:DNA polymerase-3 subunit beta|nr:DNA polymerase III subunit beta [Clostridiales Family XIII bacterium]